MPVTLRNIADEIGLSVTTVSRGLAGYSDVAEETRKRIRQVAADLGYSPNLTARRLQKQQTDTLGFIMPTFGARFSDPFFSEFIAGIGTEAAEHEYDLLVSTHAPDSEGELTTYRRAVHGGWVDGLIVVRTREDDARVNILCAHRFPFVAFGRTNCSSDYAYIDEDGVEGMHLLMQHFIDLGHRRIAYIAPPPGLMFGRYRRQGYQETMGANGLSIDPAWVVEGDMTQSGGAEVAGQLLSLRPRPTAIICSNDLTAIGAMNRIRRAGLRVGEDIAVGGFDDIPLAAYVSPPLTTVHQPIYDIGRRACRMLLDILGGQIAAESEVLLTPSLIVRESSGSVIKGR